MKQPGTEPVRYEIPPRVAGKQRTEPPATEEEDRLRATGRSIWRLHRDTKRTYWWVNAIVTAKLTKPPDTGVRDDIRRQIEEYERDAGIEPQPWGGWTGPGSKPVASSHP